MSESIEASRTKNEATAKSQKSRLGRGMGGLFEGEAKRVFTEETAVQSVEKSAPVQNKESNNTAISAVANNASSVEKPVEKPVEIIVEKIVEKIVEVKVPDDQRIWNVPIEKLVANTNQPRQFFDEASLNELTSSIREQGILQPITAVRRDEGTFEIIAGERRWRAAQRAGLKEVPVILKNVDSQKKLELAILENIQRADLNPIEEAEAYDLLMREYQLTQSTVADRLGKERSSVANTLRLLALPPEVKMMVSSGNLSAGHAKVLLGLESSHDQINLAKETVREKLSVRALEKKAQEIKNPLAANTNLAQTERSKVSAKIVETLSSELQKLIGTRVSIDYQFGKGKVSIGFHSDEQLTEIVERMRRGWAKQNP